MKKEIVLCDLCMREVPTTKHDNRDLCHTCIDAYVNMYKQAVREVELKVAFSIDHNLMLFEMLKHLNFYSLFGDKSEDMKQKFHEALSISRKKWEQ